MRITNNALINNFISNLTNNLKRLEKLQNQLSTGKKILKPSDDPLGASKSLYYRKTLREITQFERNIDDANSWMSTSDGVLADLVLNLRNAKTIAIQGANDPSDYGRDALADQVNELIKETLDNVANKSYNGEYIFAGDKVETLPFSADDKTNPTTITYSGDNSKKLVEINLGQTVEKNFTGEEVFSVSNHKIVAKKEVKNTSAPLNVALGTSFAGVQTFTISVGGAPNTNINIDPTTQSLNDLRDAINTASAGVTASIDDVGRLTLTSKVSGAEGNITITDGAANGILSSLTMADNFGRITGIEFSTSNNSFENLIVLKDALKSTSTSFDELMDLKDGSNNLGLTFGDTINLTATTTVGNINVNFIVGTDGRTFGDLANWVQTNLRTGATAAQTAIVRIRRGTLEIVNPEGTNSQPITNIRLWTNGVRANFDRAMNALGQVGGTAIPINSSFNSVKIFTSNPTHNISDKIDDIQNNLDYVLSKQTEMGAKIKRIEIAKNKLKDIKFLYTKLQSNVEDIDIAKVSLELQQQSLVYQAALAAGARIIQPSLLDFLR